MEPSTTTQEVSETLDQARLSKQIGQEKRGLWRQRYHQLAVGELLNSFPSRVFVVSLACYMLLTWFYYAALSHQTPATFSDPTSLVTIITIPWRHYDSLFFLHIAHWGYTNQRLGAFFPLYPLLVKLVAWPLGQHFTVAGLLVAWLCGWGSYLWFFRLALREYGPRVARLALLALACCPVSFFTFAPYSESLFLLVSFGAVERARAGRLWQAGALAALGMLTRPTGILLLIPLGWEWGRRNPAVVRRVGWLKRACFNVSARFGWMHRLLPEKAARPALPEAPQERPLPRFAWLALGMVPLALLGYMLYLKLVTGNALAFLKGESAWFRHFTLPWDTIGLFSIAFQRAGHAGAPELYAINILDLLLVLPLPALVLYCALRRRLWLGAALYQLALTALLVAVPTYPSGLPYEVLLSTERFMLPAFPIFLLVGQLGVARPRLYRLLLVASLILLIVNTLRLLDGNFIA